MHLNIANYLSPRWWTRMQVVHFFSFEESSLRAKVHSTVSTQQYSLQLPPLLLIDEEIDPR